MKTIALLCLFASSALAVEQGNRIVPSSDKDLSIRYMGIADDAAGDAYIHSAILQRVLELPWSFGAKGRAMVFCGRPMPATF